MLSSFLLCLLMTICCIGSVNAQRKITVVDMETHLPVYGVSVKTDTALSVMTNYKGEARIAERFDSISFTHLKYLPDRLAYAEMEDTMYLVPKSLMLPDVVVTGVNPDLKRAMKKNHEQMLMQPTMKGLTFDFANIIDRRSRRDRKHYKKAKEILREWDAK